MNNSRPSSPAAAHHEQRAGIIAGFSAYVVWGLLTIYWKQLSEFDAFELIGWRITASAVIMAIVLTATKGWSGLGVLRTDHALLARVAAAATSPMPSPSGFAATPWVPPSARPPARWSASPAG